jgi:hypothetical protein
MNIKPMGRLLSTWTHIPVAAQHHNTADVARELGEDTKLWETFLHLSSTANDTADLKVVAITAKTLRASKQYQSC